MSEVEKDEKLCGEVLVEDIKINCHYRPPFYLAMRELLKSGNEYEDTTGLSKELGNYDDALYFDIRFSLKDEGNIILYNVGDRRMYASRIDYLNNHVYNDFYILTKNMQKIKALGHSFQNSFGASNACDISLVFPKSFLEKEEEFELIYKDRVYGIKNKCRFKYRIKELMKYNFN